MRDRSSIVRGHVAGSVDSHSGYISSNESSWLLSFALFIGHIEVFDIVVITIFSLVTRLTNIDELLEVLMEPDQALLLFIFLYTNACHETGFVKLNFRSLSASVVLLSLIITFLPICSLLSLLLLLLLVLQSASRIS